MHTIQKNNHLSGENLSLLKNSSEPFFKVERATCYCPASSYILLIAQRERIYIFTDAHCVSLGFLWLDVKVDEKKNKQTNKQKQKISFS